MRYQEIIGHETIKGQLKRIVLTEKISHAYIFDGPDGIGKTMMAQAFAASVLCDDFQGEPCGVCQNCRLSFGNSHPDIIDMDLTIDKNGDIKESISVDAVRELKKDVYIKPFFAERKVYLIRDAHKMTAEAQNALLKVFEEPPGFATFILLLNGLSRLLPTILSRGVVMKFRPLSKRELSVFAGKQGIEAGEFLLNLSDGQPGRLITLASDEELVTLRNSVLQGMEELISNRRPQAIDKLFLLMKEEQESAEEILSFISTIFSDVGLVRSGNEEKVIHSDQLPVLQQLATKLEYHKLNHLLSCVLSFAEGQKKNQNYLAGMMKLLIDMWEEIHG